MLTSFSQGVYETQHSGGFETQQQNSQYLCLDLVLAFVDHMTKRVEVRALCCKLLLQTTKLLMQTSEPWPAVSVPRYGEINHSLSYIQMFQRNFRLPKSY